MRFAILGSGAVGGYYGARLARAGHDVTFIARGAHLQAIRERGLRVRSPALGDFTVHAPATDDTATVGPVDVVLLAVKTYDSGPAMAAIPPLLAPSSCVVTLQNGVDSAAELAEAVGAARVIGGTTYIATALVEPGVVEQNGTHRRIVIGEVFGELPRETERVRTLAGVLANADIQAEAVQDGRVAIWEKFVMLAAVAGFTGAARLPIGPIREDPHCRAQFLEACREIERVARAEGIPVAADISDRILAYIDTIPASMRSSLLIDLSAGRRIEVEALQGAVVRRAARLGHAVPIMSTLYAVLRPWGSPRA
jgi:2-dehydropantoate 2-reductase